MISWEEDDVEELHNDLPSFQFPLNSERWLKSRSSNLPHIQSDRYNLADALPVDGLPLNTLPVDAPRLMPTATTNTNVNSMRQCTHPPVLLYLFSPPSIARWNTYNGMHMMECTRWNVHDGMHTIDRTQRNAHDRSHTTECVQWNAHNSIRTTKFV